MSLVSKLPPEEREIPHSPGNYMSFRRLSGIQIESEQAALMRELVEQFPGDTLKSLPAPDPAVAAKARAANPLAGHSPTELLKYGLASWRGPDFDGSPCDDAQKADLDAETRRWAALQVLDVSGITVGEAQSSGDGSGQTNEITAGASLITLPPSGSQS